jgi:MoxR-like ATPase
MTATTTQNAVFAQRFEELVANVAKVIHGKDDVIRQAVECMMVEGHLLVEDVPGTGKTSLVRALAASVAVTWNRVQFTPDLLPSDITGVTVFDQATSEFSFRPGPVFANFVIGDEINRASPKTQSALLEVMEERTVTTDASVYPVPRPFMVVATQNPVDMEGTYQLPEAQLDRFLMRIAIGYPDAEHEAMVLRTQRDGPTVDQLHHVMTGDDLLRMTEFIKTIVVSPAIEQYVVEIVSRTRDMPEIRLGVSPRGGLALVRAARAHAAASGRSFVLPEDVKEVAEAVLAHRLVLHPEAELQGRTNTEMISRVLGSVPVPRSVTA